MLKFDEVFDPTSDLNRALATERLFVLRARDPAAPAAIHAWAAERIRLGLNTAEDAHVGAALDEAEGMEREHEAVRMLAAVDDRALCCSTCGCCFDHSGLGIGDACCRDMLASKAEARSCGGQLALVDLARAQQLRAASGVGEPAPEGEIDPMGSAVVTDSRAQVDPRTALAELTTHVHAARTAAWAAIGAAHARGEPIEGLVTHRVQGGLSVTIRGCVAAFLPATHVALRPVPDLDAILGQSLTFKILRLNERRGNVVLSRRALLEQERGVVELPLTVQEMVRGLVRAAELKEQAEAGCLWDDECRRALEAARSRGWGRSRVGTLVDAEAQS